MKSQELVIVLIVLLVAGAPALAGANPADGASVDAADVTLTVSVTDAFNNPISDAKVTAEWDGGSASGRTVSNGKVFLDVPEGATVTLSISHRAYIRNNPVVVQSAEQEEVDVTVYRKATAEVRVFDSAGDPLQDARVLLYKRGKVAARGQTDNDGVFQSDTIEQGDYHVVAVKQGYYKNETDVTIQGDGSLSLRITEGTVTVSVTVQDNHFDPPRPIEGASVEIGSIGTVSTSGDGEQTIAVPVNSDVTITISKGRYTTKRKDVTIGEKSKDLSFTITREDELNVSVGNERVVAGEKVRVEVVDEYGEPVANAAIMVDGGQVGTTNEDGVYQATIDSAGEHTISASHDGVSSATIPVEGIEAAAGGDGTGTATSASGGSSLPVPGFGLPAAVVALAAAALLFRRR